MGQGGGGAVVSRSAGGVSRRQGLHRQPPLADAAVLCGIQPAEFPVAAPTEVGLLEASDLE